VAGRGDRFLRRDGRFRGTLAPLRDVVLFEGSNFSGRSERLRQCLVTERRRGPVVYLGPSGASVLTGLATTVAGELELFRGWKSADPPRRWREYFGPKLGQRLASLSGGEQVLVGLAGTARNDVALVGVDCALEHLDDEWRGWALAYLKSAGGDGDACVVDNRLLGAREQCDRAVAFDAPAAGFSLRLAPTAGEVSPPVERVTIAVEGLSFGYRRGAQVFRDCSFELQPGTIYRVRGANGAGKSTLVRLLAGVLPLRKGRILLNGRPYQPYRDGNRALAAAMQNPDDQWTDVTVAGDLRRRLKRVPMAGTAPPAERVLAEWKERLGLEDHLEQHVLDLPRVLRKRLSWAWPLSGFMPWLVFDEPTIGQDAAAVGELAAALLDRKSRGHGVIFVTHDPRLAESVDATELVVGQGEVALRSHA
jgi:energy-coupling factor transport system ATP-binding protein